MHYHASVDTWPSFGQQLKPSNAKKEISYPRDSNPLFSPQCHGYTTKRKMVARMEQHWPARNQYRFLPHENIKLRCVAAFPWFSWHLSLIWATTNKQQRPKRRFYILRTLILYSRRNVTSKRQKIAWSHAWSSIDQLACTTADYLSKT